MKDELITIAVSLLLFLPTLAMRSDQSHRFSFENGMEEWCPRGTDLDDPPIEWSIERTQEIAWDGNASLKLYLENYNDAGKIWIEQSFDVSPNTRYHVNVRYSFASAAYGDFNLWVIIAGVSSESPQTAEDLTYQGDAGNGADEDVGYVWLDKSYDFRLKSGTDGAIYVFIGI